MPGNPDPRSSRSNRCPSRSRDQSTYAGAEVGPDRAFLAKGCSRAAAGCDQAQFFGRVQLPKTAVRLRRRHCLPSLCSPSEEPPPTERKSRRSLAKSCWPVPLVPVRVCPPGSRGFRRSGRPPEATPGRAPKAQLVIQQYSMPFQATLSACLPADLVDFISTYLLQKDLTRSIVTDSISNCRGSSTYGVTGRRMLQRFPRQVARSGDAAASSQGRAGVRAGAAELAVLASVSWPSALQLDRLECG